MRITKFVHSCLFVQENSINILLDPGEYTFQENALPLSTLPQLDYLLITHEHPDHFYMPLVKKIIQTFPEVKIISNNSIQEILKKENIHVSISGNEYIKLQEVPHEKALVSPPPQNVLFTLFNTLVHPGDSLSYSVNAEILAMPIVGSWGSTIQCLDHAIKIKPKVVIPIHDWHWREEARRWYYERATNYLREFGIEFKSAETGGVIEV